MNVKFPIAFEEQLVASESLNSHQRRHCTGGCMCMAIAAHDPRCMVLSPLCSSLVIRKKFVRYV